MAARAALFKAAVFIACLVPLAVLVRGALSDALGPNPIETITHTTGRWALRLLLVTLAVTPVRRVTRWNRLIAVRRMLGLFAFFYAVLHFATYVVLDHFFDWSTIVEDITKRPFIMAGFGAFVLLVPLAVTSTTGWVRRLGRRWQQLHRIIYISAALGVLHYIWKVKSDLRSPLRYAAVLAVLLLFRLAWSWRARASAYARSQS